MSPSVDALTALLQSVDAWDVFRSVASQPIDLALAHLRDKDLRGRSFAFCDLSGADLDQANLDGCSFEKTILKNASLRNASIVSCDFLRATVSDAVMDYSVIRDSKFIGTDFSSAHMETARVSGCTFSACIFRETHMDGIRFMETDLTGSVFSKLRGSNIEFNECKMHEVRLSDTTWSETRLTDCDLSGSDIRDLELSSGRISGLKITSADITRLRLIGMEVEQIDFSDSTLRGVSLIGIDLPRCVMLGTAIIDCEWPRQKATVGWWGGYRKSPSLLGHPVQDLRGLSPSLRREIADAQYLDGIYRRANNPTRAFAFRLWGATSAFGQSVLRLSTVSLLLILALSAILTVLDGHIGPWPQNATAAPKAIAAVGAAFLGIEGPVRAHPNLPQKILLVFSRASGFFVLGLWIGIAVNSLVRLSAE